MGNSEHPIELLKKIDINDMNQLQQMFDSISLRVPISITNKDGVIIKVNTKFCESIGMSEDELIGNTHRVIKHNDTPLSEYENLWEVITKKQDYYGIIKLQHKKGHAVWHIVLIRPILDEYGEIEFYFSFRIDISDHMQLKKKIEINNQLDSKTNLYKKSKLQYALKQEEKGILFVVGIKNFSQYKVFFGEEFAAKLLKIFAERLEKHYFLRFKCFSLEDDNLFAIYKPLKNNISVDKQMVKQGLLSSKEKLLSPFDIGGVEFNIDITIGVSHGLSEELMYNSMVAYESASKRNLELVYYEEGMNTSLKLIKQNFVFLNEIKYAMDNDNILLHYQPILNLEKNAIEKYECLVRMKNRTGSLTMPNEFLPIAKTAGYYSKITKIVIEKAFSYFEDKDHYFSINVSYEDIKREDFVEFLLEKLKNYKNSNKVIIEILEDEDVMESIDIANNIFEQIKETGAKVAIDDFGVGFSNIDNLLSMNIDIIKIDGKIIKKITEDEGVFEMLKGLIKMTKKKKIEVVGEFVENEQILNKLKTLKFDGGQGYFIGKPSSELVQN